MRIHCNGEATEVDADTTVGELVDRRVEDRRGIAVAVDGEVVPRADWDGRRLTEGAHVELVSAVQGG